MYVNTDLETMDIWLKSIHNQSMDPFCQSMFNQWATSKLSVLVLDRLVSAEVIEKPTQQPIDFSKSMNDEALMNEYKMIQETSQRINEHGLGEIIKIDRLTTSIHIFFLGFDSNGLPIEMNI